MNNKFDELDSLFRENNINNLIEYDIEWINFFIKNKLILEKIFDKLKLNKKNMDIFPRNELLFKALQKIKFSDIKVVFIGEDPYPNEDALGVSFLYPEWEDIPQSAKNMKKDFVKYLGKDVSDGDFRKILDELSNKYFLMLNMSLSVGKKDNKIKKHFSIWKPLFVEIINELKKNNTYFVLLGKKAIIGTSKFNLDEDNFHKSSHPSNQGYNKKVNFGNKTFDSFEDSNLFYNISNHLYNKCNIDLKEEIKLIISNKEYVK